MLLKSWRKKLRFPWENPLSPQRYLFQKLECSWSLAYGKRLWSCSSYSMGQTATLLAIHSLSGYWFHLDYGAGYMYESCTVYEINCTHIQGLRQVLTDFTIWFPKENRSRLSRSLHVYIPYMYITQVSVIRINTNTKRDSRGKRWEVNCVRQGEGGGWNWIL